ncbi:MAG TPA: DUF948 domain-containing protein [Geobacteraceae bacterium]|nr:DUF948 domain-containing protein [Geobacteraceae bacterium]
MIFVNIAAVVVAAAVVVLVIFLVPLIRELKATAISLREIASRVENDILPTVKELHEVLNEVSVITEGAAEGMESVKSLMSAVGETGKSLHMIGSVVSNAAGALSRSTLWLTGAKVAGSYLMEKLTKKRR